MNPIKVSDLLDGLWEEIEQQRVKDAEWARDPARVYTLPKRPTWDQIAARQPRVKALVDLARRGCLQDRETYNFWYERIKPQIVQLVGWHADAPPPLRTSTVYDVVYDHLLRIYEGEVA